MLAITSLNSEQHRHQIFDAGPIVLGSAIAAENGMQVQDELITAQQCEIHWQRSNDRLIVKLKNLGRSIALDVGPRIHTGVEVQLELPCVFWVGNSTIQISDPLAVLEYDQCLTAKPISEVTPINVASLEHSPAPSTLASWFDALGHLQRSRAGSHEFFERAARACFCPGGLDGAMILLTTDKGWEIAASHICYPEHGFGFRNELVQQAITERAVVFHDSQKMDAIQYQPDGHSAIVCPIFGQKGSCVAALYGFRSLNRRNNRQGIRPLEACFVELAGQSISTALARLESDAESAKARVLLEQAFSPQVAQKLQQNPRILEGQTRDVTVMFCDLREFTNIAERVGAKVTYEFLTDVMDRFSDIIRKHEGVIIDFYGDGVSAFWNAPIETPNHVELACRCALAIQNSLQGFERKWKPRLLQEIRVGVGIHTGKAQVGNSGSRMRLKYGPRGNTVNLASRLESATAHAGAEILISEEALKRLPENFIARRVCKAQLAGMNQVTDLFELMGDSATKRTTRLVDGYEFALQKFEVQEFRECLTLLSEILLDNNEDRVSEFLFKQCQSMLDNWNHENRQSTKAQLFPIVDSPAESGSSERKKPKEKMPDE